MRPHQLHELATLLAEMLRAGQAPCYALRKLETHRLGNDFNKECQRVCRWVESGSSLSSAIGALIHPWFSAADLAVMRAGERSGRLPEALEAVATIYQKRGHDFRELLAAVAYPCFLIHMAAMAFPISTLQALVLEGNWSGYLAQKLLFLLPLYLVTAGFAFCMFTEQPVISRWRETLLLAIPGLRHLWQAHVCARAAGLMSALLQTDLNMGIIWPLVASGCGSYRLQSDAERWKQDCLAGRPPRIGDSTVLHSHFMHRYEAAAESGKLIQAVSELETFFVERETFLRRSAIRLAGSMIYIIVVFAVAAAVLAFYVDYFNQVLPR